VEPKDDLCETILVVDDSPVQIKITTTILNKSEYRVLSARDGSECIKITKKIKPDLILLDIDMPGMNGIEVCMNLNNDPKTKDIPIIFVTGITDDNTLKEAFDAGGTDCVRKPVNQVELLSRIKSVLNNQKLNKIRLEKEKLIGVLEMAGAVCHELNQPLQAISMIFEIIMEDLSTNTEMCKSVDEISQEIDRVGVIMKKLMHITKYKTREYIRGEQIIDIDKASSAYLDNGHIPERRSGKDRRSGLDRRLKPRSSK